MDDYIKKQAAIDVIFGITMYKGTVPASSAVFNIQKIPAEPVREVVLCKDCKHNPKDTWFECPMAGLSENQRPETAWCWRGERRDG